MIEKSKLWEFAIGVRMHMGFSIKVQITINGWCRWVHFNIQIYQNDNLCVRAQVSSVCKRTMCPIEPNHVSCIWNIVYDTLVRYTAVVPKWFYSILELPMSSSTNESGHLNWVCATMHRMVWWHCDIQKIKTQPTWCVPEQQLWLEKLSNHITQHIRLISYLNVWNQFF